ncbi:uracil-DNA glycosylase [Inhella proteolytica]|uniref:Uracil-DNA glycosylase n=1 Tax=Inhella proteolytica TaxID=2795029 RepID=A0A931JAS8_9BURK|nr:uracil-DNA glycosylase [Inhella proteolytica]MBH9579577.1 uracil-DNA glycosylase [Inhella proteolytica]
MSALQEPLGAALARARLDAGWQSPLVQWREGAQPLIDRIEAWQRAGAQIYPAQPLRALELTPLSACRVVILGQDPYHGPGQAEGLAFSVPVGQKLPPSLRNIYKELQRDLGLAPAAHGHLGGWARRGVLLLNTVLTVEDGQAGAHAGWGWEALTDALIRAVAADPRPKAFLLWGAHAQSKQPLLQGGQHLVLTANHPSPLSALRPPRPFIGCGHFGAVQRWLEAQGQSWSWAVGSA